MRILLGFLLTLGLWAEELRAQSDHIWKLSELNLASILLKDANDLSKESAMHVIREVNRENPRVSLGRTVIPLTKVLRANKNYSLRILAAITLFELCDERASFAIRHAALYDANKTVRHVCKSINIALQKRKENGSNKTLLSQN